MRFVFAAVLLFLGVAAMPAAAAHPNNPIQWRPKDDALASTPIWGYDANGDIACPTQDGRTCITSRELYDARNAAGVLSCADKTLTGNGVSGYDIEGHWCRVLGLEKGNQHGYKWNPPAHGVTFYWRRNPATGDIECASDGANCYWWAPSLESAFKRTTVVSCQPTDYTRAGHWCASLASQRKGNGYEWKLHQTLHSGRTPDRAIDDSWYSYSASGDIQCPSNDGVTCEWPRTKAEAEAMKKPVVCGDEHEATFGYNGYDTPGHWCRRFVLAEGNNKGFSYPWGLFGLVAGAGSPDVMCASDDAENCHWGAPLSVSLKAANPLVCGPGHAASKGISGYETDGHWCRQYAAPDLRGHTVRIVNTAGLPAQVCRPVAFQGEDRDDPLTEIRCTDLAAGSVAAPATTTVTVLPIPETQDFAYLYEYVHQWVCVETPGLIKLFVDAARDADPREISIDQYRIQGGPGLLDATGASQSCREAIGFAFASP